MHLHFLVKCFHPFPILATVSIKLFILPFPLLIILFYTRVCKVDLQIFFLFREALPAYKEKLETVSKVSDSQVLNGCIPSLTAALLPIAVALYLHSVFTIDKISGCIFAMVMCSCIYHLAVIPLSVIPLSSSYFLKQSCQFESNKWFLVNTLCNCMVS